MRVDAFAKSIDSCQPAQSAQADMGRNFSLSVQFLHFKRLFYCHYSVGLVSHKTYFLDPTICEDSLGIIIVCKNAYGPLLPEPDCNDIINIIKNE